MEFSVAERGLSKLLRNSYQYIKRKDLAEGFTSWECVERRKGKCKVKLTAVYDFVAEINEHTHAPSPTNCELTRIRANIKRKAETTQDTTQQILAAEFTNITPTAAVNLPNLNTLRRNIRLQRQEGNILLNPLRREDIPVLPQCQVTATSDRFLLYDSGIGDVNRMFIFVTDGALDLLARSPQWFADGTFKLCPELFFQINHEVIPCVFRLLPAKNEASYVQFLTTVRNAVRNIGNVLVGILVDFEVAAINAIGNVMSALQISGCFYHLSSNLWRHIQRAGLQERDMTEEHILHVDPCYSQLNYGIGLTAWMKSFLALTTASKAGTTAFNQMFLPLTHPSESF